MDKEQLNELTVTAAKVRLGIIEGIFNAGSGHPGGSLSCADILTYLYFAELNINPSEPNWEERDRFVLSKGHAAPALYSVLANRGFFDVGELKTLRHLGSRLQGHPDMHSTPGVDMSTGSLGQGISTACGMALAAKLGKKDYRVYTVTGDGETEEGEVWEAAMFASHYKLDNLIAFIDVNGLQIDGKTSEVMNTEPVDKRFEAFGWFVQRINGHDFEAIDKAVKAAKSVAGKPSAIICNTIKGKGVSFMEGKAGWHGIAPKKDEYEAAIAEITASLK